MSFSKRQQPEFRALIPLAWIAHCQRKSLTPTRTVDRHWYERELSVATGHTSTKDCNPGRDYDRAMAHFETLAGTGIKWQMRIFSGDVKRMLHSLTSELGEAALRLAGIDERYLLNALQNGFGTREPWQLNREDLLIIIGEVKRSIRRSTAHSQHIRDEKAKAPTLRQENGKWQ